ncbi:alpha-mannosidase [Acutalibacter sp. 1XD8-33]|uniref:alpha-mannosidase n=1 Tax=Acutalibacter sp. 1XD8-33 TaxID=2320081 RepID=UPI001313D994|nr:alpha-mannosidase [Acutalibacter sp. 1XD8-33]
MKKKTRLFLVGNAHLDSVWQWRWQEGSAEAKATIRSALDRMKEFPEFRFVCSSASVFQWVQEFAPDMFQEVRQRVKEGRLIVVGGWQVQPDCNLPSGEAFARQSLYAQRYFQEQLGVTAKAGYCVDSFGHNGMLPQILRKSGMDSYVFMRPAPHEKSMDSDLFRWVSPDGSAVTTYRIPDPYCFNFQSEEELQVRLDYLEEHTAADTELLPFFYGVGNHGGGPTIRNLEVLEAYQKAHPELEMIYSDLSDFFRELESSCREIPEYRGDLQHHASGCYSTVPQMKNGIRRSECELLAAERYAVLAGKLCRKPAKTERFREAWKTVGFLHFHDLMGGCSIREVYDDAAYQYGMALHTAAVEENNALQSISWAIDTSQPSKGLPVVVFNPNGFPVTESIAVNMQSKGVTDSAGNSVLSQLVHSTAAECYWRRDTLFQAQIPALGYGVYYLQNPIRTANPEDYQKNQPKPAGGAVTAVEFAGVRTANERRGTVLENQVYRVEFDLHSGYIVSFLDKETQKELISGPAAVPVVIDEYYHDTWSHGKNFFSEEMARFGDAQVEAVEFGPIRATVKVVSQYNRSALVQYFSLESGCGRLKIRAWVDWQERHKMLKLIWPMKVDKPEAVYEIPFGVIRRPADGEEEPGQTWTAVVGGGEGFALLNNNTYSSSVKESTLCQTVVRSPIFGDHGGPRTGESEFTGQGRFEFASELMPVRDGNWAPVIQAARQLNKPVSQIIESWHPGTLPDASYAGIQIDQENVMLSALKPSEDGKGLVIRLYETNGVETDVRVSGGLLPVALKARFTPYSVNTYYLAEGSGSWKEVLLTEYDL